MLPVVANAYNHISGAAAMELGHPTGGPLQKDVVQSNIFGSFVPLKAIDPPEVFYPIEYCSRGGALIKPRMPYFCTGCD